MSATIRITGIEEILRRLDAATATQTLQRAMLRSVNLLVNRVADYPVQRSGSTYRRTGTLGRRWTARVETGPKGVIGRVGNNTIYGPWVQSKRFQSRVHRGRWQTDQAVMERSLAEIEGHFQQELQAALDGRR
jgi:hypothetical protein